MDSVNWTYGGSEVLLLLLLCFYFCKIGHTSKRLLFLSVKMYQAVFAIYVLFVTEVVEPYSSEVADHLIHRVMQGGN